MPETIDTRVAILEERLRKWDEDLKDYETWRRTVDQGLDVARGGRTAAIAITSGIISVLSLLAVVANYLNP